MHTKPLVRWHRLHHTSRTPTVWSNDNFTLIDSFSVQSFFLILPIFVPVPPLVLVAFRLYDQTRGMIGHSGHEYVDGIWARWPWPLVCTLHHDDHHALWRYNFANQFTWWDRLFGTLDPQYDAKVRAFARRARTSGPDNSDDASWAMNAGRERG